MEADSVIRARSAVFVDVMGFAAAQERLTAEQTRLLQDHLLNGHRPEHIESPDQDVLRVLSTSVGFHDVLTREFERRNAHSDFFHESAELLEFSDCAYFITPSEKTALKIASSVWYGCTEAAIPVRLGVGTGSYARLSFSIGNRANGTMSVTVPFLGTAAIRAYNAHRCKAKGFRVFVHPSVRRRTLSYSPLTVDEVSDDADAEINMFPHDLAARPGRLTHWIDIFQQLRATARTESARAHYDETQVALQRLSETQRYL